MSLEDTIKCGRIVYELTDGDRVLDNGLSLMLVSRGKKVNEKYIYPKVSKKSFEEFKRLENVRSVNEGVTRHYWIYEEHLK